MVVAGKPEAGIQQVILTSDYEYLVRKSQECRPSFLCEIHVRFFGQHSPAIVRTDEFPEFLVFEHLLPELDKGAASESGNGGSRRSPSLTTRNHEVNNPNFATKSDRCTMTARSVNQKRITIIIIKKIKERGTNRQRSILLD